MLECSKHVELPQATQESSFHPWVHTSLQGYSQQSGVTLLATGCHLSQNSKEEAGPAPVRRGQGGARDRCPPSHPCILGPAVPLPPALSPHSADRRVRTLTPRVVFVGRLLVCFSPAAHLENHNAPNLRSSPGSEGAPDQGASSDTAPPSPDCQAPPRPEVLLSDRPVSLENKWQ